VPPAEEEAEGGQGEEVEDDDGVPVELEGRGRAPDRDVEDGGRGGGQGEDRQEAEHALVGLGRDDRLLGNELDEVGERLEEGRPHPVLEARVELAVDELEREPEREEKNETGKNDDEKTGSRRDFPSAYLHPSGRRAFLKSTPRARCQATA